jgi:hypothetical protein
MCDGADEGAQEFGEEGDAAGYEEKGVTEGGGGAEIVFIAAFRELEFNHRF